MDRISALMDGELEPTEAQRVMAGLKTDPADRIRWDEFHLVRDALRSEPLLSADFSENFSRRLAEEPTVLAPRRSIARPGRFTAYALSAAASVSVAALVAWVAVQPGATSEPVPPLARKEAAPELHSVPSDGRMNEYLLAHEGFSPSTALQGLAPYIRTVSMTRPAERR